jgi:hypothetical protein
VKYPSSAPGLLFGFSDRNILRHFAAIPKEPSCAVLKEPELPVFFDLALLLNIVPDHLFVAVRPDGADKISIRPELAAPQVAFHFRAGFKDFSCRHALDDLDNLFRAVPRHTLHQKMHVIPVRANFQERNFVSFLNLGTDFFQFVIDGCAQHTTSVLSRAHDVIQQDGNIMVLVNELAHSRILKPQQAAGN